MKASKIVQRILDTIGAKPEDTIHIRRAQAERPEEVPDPGPPPGTLAEWQALRELDKAALSAMGCASYGGGVMIFPREWYESIPDGFLIETINGTLRPFSRDTCDRDSRYGYLAYGIRVADRG